jgi:hypothetical protein
MVTFTSGSARASPITISGLTFQSTQTNSGEVIYSSVTINLLVDRCHLGGTVTSTGTLVSVAGASRLRITNSHLSINSTAGTSIATAVTAKVIVSNTVVAPTNSGYTGSALKLTGSNTIDAVELDFSAVAAPPNYAIELQSADDDVRITGTTVFSTTSYPLYGLRLFNNAQVYAAGNQLAGFTGVYSIAGASSFLAPGSYLEMGGASQVTGALTAVTIPDGVTAAGYNLSSTVPAVTMPKPFFIGQRLTIIIENSSGGAWGNIGFTGSSATLWGASSRNPASGEVCITEWVCMAANSSTPQFNAVQAKVGSA